MAKILGTWKATALLIFGTIVVTMVSVLVGMSTDMAIRRYFGPRYVELNRQYYMALTQNEIELINDFDKLQIKYEKSVDAKEKTQLIIAMMSIRNTLGDRIPPAKLDALRKMRKVYFDDLTK